MTNYGAGDTERPNFLSSEWHAKVAKTTDSDLRAHRIALTYLELSRCLDEALKRPPENGQPDTTDDDDEPAATNANWFHFALWGGLSVSQNIGNDRPLQRLNGGLAMPLRRLLTPAVLNVKASRGQQVARALAWGQLLIFASSCTALRLFVEHDEVAEDRLLEGIAELKIPKAVDELFGVQRDRHAASIASAFGYYRLARTAPTPAIRAKFILGANVLLTEVEQDIANLAVNIVVNMVPRRIADGFDWRLAKLAERFRGVPTQLSYLALPFMRVDERRALDLLWSRFMTDQVLVMALPTETLRVGRDIPPRRRDAPFLAADLEFPKTRAELEKSWECRHGARRRAKRCADCEAAVQGLVDIATRVRSLDRTVGNGRGSAARDWRQWDERMNWALTLMQSRQHDDTLFWRPYSERDELRIIRGDLPLRSGDPSSLDVGAPLNPKSYCVPNASRVERYTQT